MWLRWKVLSRISKVLNFMKENLFIFIDFNETHMLHEFKIHQTTGHMDDGSNFDREHVMT
jgi:hypothetical protein